MFWILLLIPMTSDVIIQYLLKIHSNTCSCVVVFVRKSITSPSDWTQLVDLMAVQCSFYVKSSWDLRCLCSLTFGNYKLQWITDNEQSSLSNHHQRRVIWKFIAILETYERVPNSAIRNSTPSTLLWASSSDSPNHLVHFLYWIYSIRPSTCCDAALVTNTNIWPISSAAFVPELIWFTMNNITCPVWSRLISVLPFGMYVFHTQVQARKENKGPISQFNFTFLLELCFFRRTFIWWISSWVQVLGCNSGLKANMFNWS